MLKHISSTFPLLHKTVAPVYIYLRDHNQHINPPPSILNVSYRNPQHFAPDAPLQTTFEYPLSKSVQELLDRQIFEEYKNKILRGTIDEE